MTRDLPPSPATLPEALERAAGAFPERGIALFDGRGRSHERRTFPEILESVRASAGRWAELGLAPGDRVLVGLPTSWPFLECWLGAVWNGSLPFAVAPPGGFGAAGAHVRKVESLVERLDTRFAVITPGFVDQAEARGAGRLLAAAITPEAQARAATRRVHPRAEAEACAFLQLTSGSTGIPRAVMISHRAAIHNAEGLDAVVVGFEGEPWHAWADAEVGWLPLHHDMGLIGFLLTSILLGIDLWLFPSNVFLARPRRWLEAVGSHGRTATHGPNFGYQLCVERLSPEDREGLDLGGWVAADTGAEMVRPETIASFLEAFGPYGFRPETFRPCYGLAEATLCVTMDTELRGLRTRPVPPSAEGSDPGDEVACVGAPVPGTELRIADPSGAELPDDAVGEVWVRSPSLMTGYWEDPEATAEAFAGDWHRTGDLGFLHDGELYITGRLKDILILRGTNFMPHEIEWLAESVSGGGGSFRSGAFSVDHGGEGEEAVLVVEAGDRDPERQAEMERQIRLDVAHTLGIQLADVVFVRRGRIPKTTSGKVQRRQLRRLYLDGDLVGDRRAVGQ